MKSYKTLADNLDKRTAEITEGINHLTGNATKQIEIVGADLHRTLGNDRHGGEEFRQESEPAASSAAAATSSAYSAAPPAAGEGASAGLSTTGPGDAAATRGRRTTIQ